MSITAETKVPVSPEPDATIRTKVASGRQRVERAKANVEAAIAAGKQQLEELCDDMVRRTTSGQMQAVDPMKEMDKIGTPPTKSSALRGPTPPPLPKR
jgi:hypothetical protein